MRERRKQDVGNVPSESRHNSPLQNRQWISVTSSFCFRIPMPGCDASSHMRTFLESTVHGAKDPVVLVDIESDDIAGL